MIALDFCQVCSMTVSCRLGNVELRSMDSQGGCPHMNIARCNFWLFSDKVVDSYA
jgi:hypothetical protein